MSATEFISYINKVLNASSEEIISSLKAFNKRCEAAGIKNIDRKTLGQLKTELRALEKEKEI